MQSFDQSFDIVLGRFQIWVWRFVDLIDVEELSHHAVVNVEYGRCVLNLARETLHQEQNTSGLKDHRDKVIPNVLGCYLSLGLKELDRNQEV